MKKGKLLFVIVVTFVFKIWAITEPYLISATAINDSSVQLTWRNNSSESIGYLIYRKINDSVDFHFVKSILQANTTTCIDGRLKDSTTYTYAVKSYSVTDTSMLSNQLDVTTRSLTHILGHQLDIAWGNLWIPGEKFLLYIYDKSNCEEQYEIYRSENFSDYSLVGIMKNDWARPINVQLKWDDTTFIPKTNEWYSYKVISRYKNDSAVAIDTFFTFHFPEIADSLKIIKPGRKLGSVPIKYSMWAMKIGDTILLPERGMPESTYSIIDIHNSESPRFCGLKKYNPKSAYKYGYISKNQDLYCYQGKDLFWYKYDDSLFIKEQITVDSLGAGPEGVAPGFSSWTSFLQDSLLVISNHFNSNVFVNVKNSKMYIESKNVNKGYYSIYNNVNADKVPLQERSVIINNRIYYTVNITIGAGARFIGIIDFSKNLQQPLKISASGYKADIPWGAVYYNCVNMRRYNVVFDDHIITDSLAEYRKIFLDSINQRIVLISDSLLTIYSYNQNNIDINKNKIFYKKSEQGKIFSLGRQDSETYLQFKDGYYGQVKVFTIGGRLLKKFTTNKGDNRFQMIPKGIFIINFQDKSRVVTERVISF